MLRVVTHLAALFIRSCTLLHASTVALYLFDEGRQWYPSGLLSDSSPNRYALVIGNGGQIVAGHFGNGISFAQRPPIALPAGSTLMGLKPIQMPAGRTVEPLWWKNANFGALMTSGCAGSA